ncbi:hypothetical protein TWF696_005660 [Orbilia brochopaga]|uniref:Uncharacterized protein n=1 Tax=Orbilia brochopaga TaxID=3140254 RepID=A0AAV9V265_9PEZI
MRFGTRCLLFGLLALTGAPQPGNCACQYDDVQSFQSCSTRYTAVQPRSVSFSTYTQFRTNGHTVTVTTTVDAVTVTDARQATTITVTVHPTSTSIVFDVYSGTTIWTSTVSTTMSYTVYTPTTVYAGVATVFATPAAKTLPTSAGFTAVLDDPANKVLYNDLPRKKARREAQPGPEPVPEPIPEPVAAPGGTWEPVLDPMPDALPAPIGRRASYPDLVVCKKIIKVTFVTTVVQTLGRRTVTIAGQTTTRTIEQPPTAWLYHTPSDAITIRWTEYLVTNIGPRTTTTIASEVTVASSTVTSTLPQKTVYAACADINRAPMPNELADFIYHIDAGHSVPATGAGGVSFGTNDTEYECCNACHARPDCAGSLWTWLQAWGAPCDWEPDGLCQPGEEPVYPPDLARCDLWLTGTTGTCSNSQRDTFRLASPYNEPPKVVSNGPKCAYWKYSR